MICFGRISLLCCAASRDVSVSAFRASMADAVSAGASASVEKLATSPLLKGHVETRVRFPDWTPCYREYRRNAMRAGSRLLA